MSNITLLTNSEWVEMVGRYQSERTDEAFNEIYHALNPLAVRLGHKWHNLNGSLRVEVEEFINMAQFAIFEAVESFDGSQGSKFVSFYKQHVGWAIQDEIIKKNKTKTAEFNRESYYLEHKVKGSEGEEGTFKEAVSGQLAITEEEVYGSVTNSDSESAFSKVMDIVSEFENTASADDGAIIRTIINFALEVSDVTTRKVNDKLAEVFTDVKPATLRKKKQRALDRFAKFAKENGLGEMNLSQF